MALSKNNLVSEAWKIFYDRLKSDIPTITGLGVQMPDGTNEASIKHFVSSYSDKLVESKDNYPFVVIEPPVMDSERFTSGKSRINYTITIEVYANQAEVADKFLDEIFNSIETYKRDLSDKGIHNLNIDSTENDFVERDSLKIHVRSITLNFDFIFNKTNGY